MADTVRKLLAMLARLAEQSGGATVAELSYHCGLPRTTTYRLITILRDEGYVWKDGMGRYRLGGKVFQLASGLADHLAIREAARPFLDELARLTQETVHLAVLEGDKAVYIEKIDTTHAVGLMSRVGQRIHLHSTALGKAMLAFLPESEADSILQRAGLPALTPNTITNLALLRAHLAEVRKQGYAIDNCENRAGVVCVGAPIFDASARPCGAVSVSAPAVRLSVEQARLLAPAVVEAARGISRALGFSHQS